MTISKVVLMPALAVLLLGSSAHAQEWVDRRGYVAMPDDDDDGGYYDRRQTYWHDGQSDYQRDDGRDYPYYYRDDPDRYGQDDGYEPRRRPQRQASVNPDAANPNLDPGIKDDAQAAQAQSPIPRVVVPYSGYAPGTIIISTKERRLYLMLDDNTALKYGIGVGKQGFSWKGEESISNKREWPDWTPPKEMIARRPELPDHMDGGLNNPLGARALYLGSTLYRIHGTNEPNSIGKAVSSGCIRMANPDIMDLYNRVGVGTQVVVL